MKEVKSIQDVYPAVAELAVELEAVGEARLAEVLDHRLRQVAWTTGSELLEELQSVLTKALEPDAASLPRAVREQIERVLHVIGTFVAATGAAQSTRSGRFRKPGS